MSTTRHFEASFETVIEAHLLQHGYVSVGREGFDRERAIFPQMVIEFIRETQPSEWTKLEALHGAKTEEQVLADLCKWMDTNGSLATLRHGFKCYGRMLRVAFFKAAHELNPELEARYAANQLGITRQLRFSPRSEMSLDVTLSLNGVPVTTIELKNPLTGQTVDDALRQYRHNRDPREPIFEFKRRTLVHFAADTERVRMTTRLAGNATHFLPFDKGSDGGAGNPPDPAGRTYRTAYLWEEVLARDSLLDILARFLHVQAEERRDEQGRKVKVETMIFPRYHQLDGVRRLVAATRAEGVGHNYLVEHSAGSGKSNTIGWLAHRLASLHDEGNARVFDSVVVVTDRVVLDQQLQDTIYQFEHKRGVVQQIDERSRQLAEALENAVPIIITTLQKFPFVSRFTVLQRDEEEEAELWRGKVEAFRNLYAFLSQIIPYQDSDLERLYVFLRHLVAKLPRRRGGPTYEFDDDVRLEYYRLQKISEGSISLQEGQARPLDGPSEVGSGLVRAEEVPLSQLIDLVNERFGTDFNQADQLFFDQIVEAAVTDDGLRQAAGVNPEDKFELVFRNLLERLFVERMDQNEEIFVRYMNDARFREVVSGWMASQAYKRLRSADAASASGSAARPLPSGLRLVEGSPKERYVTCVPLVPLKAAAGVFSDPQNIADDDFEWVAVESRHRLRKGMFVAQVAGKSMEPAIPDGTYCLFLAPVEGTRQGKTVLVQLRDATDPETGQRYTVKRYESEKAKQEDAWRHTRITLKPINPACTPIVLTGAEEGTLQVIAEVVEVLGVPEVEPRPEATPEAGWPNWR